MARITLASQAAAHDIAIKALQAQLDVANEVCANLRTTVANRDRTIDDLAACIEARDATIAVLNEVHDQACITLAAQAERLDNAVAYFKAQRTTPVVVAAQPKAAPVPTVSTYRDSQGQTWERTRYSATRSIARRVEASAETACA